MNLLQALLTAVLSGVFAGSINFYLIEEKERRSEYKKILADLYRAVGPNT